MLSTPAPPATTSSPPGSSSLPPAPVPRTSSCSSTQAHGRRHAGALRRQLVGGAQRATPPPPPPSPPARWSGCSAPASPAAPPQPPLPPLLPARLLAAAPAREAPAAHLRELLRAERDALGHHLQAGLPHGEPTGVAVALQVLAVQAVQPACRRAGLDAATATALCCDVRTWHLGGSLIPQLPGNPGHRGEAAIIHDDLQRIPPPPRRSDGVMMQTAAASDTQGGA